MDTLTITFDSSNDPEPDPEPTTTSESRSFMPVFSCMDCKYVENFMQPWQSKKAKTGYCTNRDNYKKISTHQFTCFREHLKLCNYRPNCGDIVKMFSFDPLFVTDKVICSKFCLIESQRYIEKMIERANNLSNRANS